MSIDSGIRFCLAEPYTLERGLSELRAEDPDVPAWIFIVPAEQYEKARVVYRAFMDQIHLVEAGDREQFNALIGIFMATLQQIAPDWYSKTFNFELNGLDRVDPV